MSFIKKVLVLFGVIEDETIEDEIRKTPVFRRRLYFIAILDIIVIGALFPVLRPLESASRLVVFCIIILATTAVLATVAFQRIRKEKLPSGKEFSPIGQDSSYMERGDHRSRVEQALNREEESVLFLTGKSGVGKSTLIKNIVGPELDTWNISYVKNSFSESIDFKMNIRNKIGEEYVVDANSFLTDPILEDYFEVDSLLIFDHFERFLKSGSEELFEWFYKFVENFTKHKGNHMLVILRKKYYADLRFMYGKIDIFGNTEFMTGVSTNKVEGKKDTRRYRDKLLKVVKESETVDLIINDLQERNELSPLKLQMAGLMLDDYEQQKEGGSIMPNEYNTEIGGSTGLVRRYFNRYIESTVDNSTAGAVLYALSISGRNSLSQGDIVSATHRPEGTVESVLETLREGGLILQTTDQEYKIAHDYLSESFVSFSKGILDSEDRDNVRSFIEAQDQGVVDSLSDLLSYSVSSDYTSLDVVFSSVALLIFARLLYPSIGLDVNMNLHNSYIEPPCLPFGNSTYVDLLYLPSFIASLACCFYTYQVYRNVCFRIPVNKMFTYLDVCVTVLCIILGMVFPHFWALFAGVAGTFIGVELWLSYGRFESYWVVQNGNIMDRTISYFFIFMFFTLLIGVVMGLFRYNAFFGVNIVDGSDNQVVSFTLELFVSVCMLLYMIESWRTHASKTRAPIVTGLWDRLKIHNQTHV
jgi:energy-coupling factor transporter ATP-binding protein EcfA2